MKVCTPLETCESLQLQLIRHSTDIQSCFWLYDQKNVALSRKFILPFLATHFEVKARKFPSSKIFELESGSTALILTAENQLDVDALAGVEILIPNGEMSPNKPIGGQNGVPSISYSTVATLGVGDPISQVRKL